MSNARLGHIRIEKVQLKGLSTFLRGPGWRWRTKSIRGGQIGVWSERYESEVDCDRSIHAHQAYMAGAPITTVRL